MKRVSLVAFMILLAHCAKAQMVDSHRVNIFKDGKIVASYDKSEVDSIQYTPYQYDANQVFYYYVGWTRPTSLNGEEQTSLRNLAIAPNGGTIKCFFGDKIPEYSRKSPLMDLYMPEDKLSTETRDHYYVVIPNGISIYDGDGDVTRSQYYNLKTEYTDAGENSSFSFPGYKVFKSAAKTSIVYGILLY